jgi:uncharacterized protein (DUF302 family)
MISYGFTKQVGFSFEETIARVTDALKAEGFSVLHQIDLQEKFKEKLGIDFRKYTILGACNPANAFKAIQAEENIGLLLPCNVLVYEKDGKIAISVIKPLTIMKGIGNSHLCDVAAYVETILKRVFDAV